MNPRERLQYALYLQRLHDLFVIKENIAFEYQHKNYNKAAKQIDIAVDKMLHDNVVNAVDGTVSLKDPKLDHIIEEALTGQQNMLVKNPDHYIRNAVEQNTKQFSNFLQNRIEKENYSLQKKIQEEYDKRKNEKISDEQLKKEIKEKYSEHGRKRAKNIVKDALHTNQAHMSWVSSREGYKYKVWMNGQSKSGVRYWHVRSKIQPVEIDDFFDIFGPTGQHARMMYPGDLNGGAENVANCKCWLYYTNIAPSNLKKKGTIQINPHVTLENENSETFSVNTEEKVLFKRIREKIRNRFTPNSADSTSLEDVPSDTKWNKDPNKVVEWNGKKVYGIGESDNDKLAFQKEYGITENDLTRHELSFVQFYSHKGDKILHKYNRKVKECKNPIKKLKFKRECSKKWYEEFKDYENYITFSRALRESKSIFKKGKPLKEDIVIVRRQRSPLSERAIDGIYHSDSYLSTTISENVKVETYGPYKNFIVVPKGTKILYIEEITWTSEDYEILFEKDIDLKIIEEKSEFLTHWEML